MVSGLLERLRGLPLPGLGREKEERGPRIRLDVGPLAVQVDREGPHLALDLGPGLRYELQGPVLWALGLVALAWLLYQEAQAGTLPGLRGREAKG